MGTRAVRWTAEDQAAHVRREKERERAEWNRAVDVKKADRQDRRAARFWSKA
jgi:hypothetical protein